MNSNQEQTNPPVRPPEELAYFQQLIEQATRNGIVRAIIQVRDFPAQDQLLRELAPFQVSLVTKYQFIPALTLDVNATALIYMRDSHLVINVRPNSIGYPISGGQTNPPVRSPEELALFQRLIDLATSRGTARVIVGARDFPALDELLQQLAPFQVSLGTRYEVIPAAAMTVNAAALIFMRDSVLVTGIQENSINNKPTTTNAPVRIPEQLTVFRQLVKQATINGPTRVIVGVQASFTPEGYLTPAQRQAPIVVTSITPVVISHPRGCRRKGTCVGHLLSSF